MNYSRALKGSLTRSGAINEISSQAELELGHPLTKDEESIIFGRFSPQNILERIKKVMLYICCV
jgi:hypothetical protein